MVKLVSEAVMPFDFPQINVIQALATVLFKARDNCGETLENSFKLLARNVYVCDSFWEGEKRLCDYFDGVINKDKCNSGAPRLAFGSHSMSSLQNLLWAFTP